MSTALDRRRVVLIFGDPGHGKSHLARRLECDRGYHPVGLDAVYVDFVRRAFPLLYLPGLNYVIAQHYHQILIPCDRTGVVPGAAEAWRDHVCKIVTDALAEHELLSVEGFLLLPVLRAVQENLRSLAVVTTVEARNKQYFVANTTDELLEATNPTPGHT